MPIATAVAWFHDCDGGEFAFYPNGPDGTPEAHPVRFNTGLLLDTDSTFHGVDRVSENAVPIADLKPGMRLTSEGDGRWRVLNGKRTVAEYRWDQLRFSVSWKAYCFSSEAERAAWHSHTDDISLGDVVDRLTNDMRDRGIVGADLPHGNELVNLIIDEYIRFPAALAS
jgi:hypothetical protein